MRFGNNVPAKDYLLFTDCFTRPYLPTGQPNVRYNLPPEGIHDYQQPIDPHVVTELKNRSGICAWGKMVDVRTI